MKYDRGPLICFIFFRAGTRSAREHAAPKIVRVCDRKQARRESTLVENPQLEDCS